MMKPNIILFLADDLGWNDVGWHNPHMPTPTMNKMAKEGVILNQHYVTPQCTPSRSTIMTSLYPHRVGMQHFVILNQQPTGVPTKFTFLPKLLKEHAGYNTHAIGKWHLGHCKWEYTPTYRGFDTHYGLLLGGGEFYDHTSSDYNGDAYLDFRDNKKKDPSGTGKYMTELFIARAVKVIKEAKKENGPLFMYFAPTDVHDPMDVPEAYKKDCPSYLPKNRTISCAKVSVLDHAMRKIMDALASKSLLDNTLIIFMADNGGHPFENFANNWPLRGLKGTFWDGGSRSAAFVWGSKKLLPKAPFTTNGFVHATDWLPTILAFAGIKAQKYLDYDIDGVDVSRMLRENVGSPRSEFVINIDETLNGAAIRQGKWKLIVGNTGISDYSKWYPEPMKGKCPKSAQGNEYCTKTGVADYIEDEDSTSYSRLMPDAAANGPSVQLLRTNPGSCFDKANLHLYNMDIDEAEKHNLAKDKKNKKLIIKLCKRLHEYIQKAVPTQFIDNENGVATVVGDTTYYITMNLKDSWPSMHDNVWGPTWC